MQFVCDKWQWLLGLLPQLKLPILAGRARARSGQIMNFKPVRLDYHIDKYRGN